MEPREKGSHIRIAVIDHSPEIGGAESSLLTFLRHMDKKQFDAVVLLNEEGEFSRRLREEQVSVEIIRLPLELIGLERGHALRSFFSLVIYLFYIQAFLGRLCLYLKRNRFHLVLTNTVKAHLLGSIAARLCSLPVLWRFHDILSPSDFSPVWIKAIVLFGKFFPKRILAVSKMARDHLVRHGLESSKVEVVFNGVDDELLKPHDPFKSIREELGLAGKARLVGCIGRIVPQKGQKSLLLAVPGVLREYPETFFLIIGDTFYRDETYKEELLKIIRERGMGDRIRFTGFRTDIGDVIQSLDLIVYPSVAPESFGLSILEGMSLGKPVIASKIGGVPEIIEDGVTGILVEPNHPEQITDRILYLFRNREICDRIGQTAEEVVRKKFPMGNYIEAMENALRTWALREVSH